MEFVGQTSPAGPREGRRINVASFSEIAQIIARVSPHWPIAYLRGRLRHLNTMSFPPVEAGPGRIDYGPSELLALVLALEFSWAGIPPTFMISRVLESWPEIARAFSVIGQSASASECPTRFLVVSSGQSDSARLVFIPSVDRAADLRSSIVIDAYKLYRSVLQAWESEMQDDLFEHSIVNLGMDVEDNKTRLDGRDWFWSRAANISDYLVENRDRECHALPGDLADMLLYLSDPLPRESAERFRKVPIGRQKTIAFLDGLKEVIAWGSATYRDERGVGDRSTDTHRNQLIIALNDFAHDMATSWAPEAPRPGRGERRKIARESGPT